MILRRITEHVKAQNWTAIALDFVIVVVGVFVGIQMANWNQSRLDRADEKIFLERLHPDIVRVENSSARVRQRRISLIDDLRSASSTIFSNSDVETLSPQECFALSVSHYYNINVLGLPSLAELTSSGRVSIIEDAEMRTALVDYQQRVAALSGVIAEFTPQANNLLMLEPELLQISPIMDVALGEMQTSAVCDLPAMRQNRAFLNAVAENVDAYDAYLRDGLLPWNIQLEEIHDLVDAALGIQHPKETP